jgi:Zn-dependent protease
VAFDLPGTVRDLALTLVPMILSLSVHEYAHAWSAYKLGDTTAKDDGRLTLNPLVHIDPVGTLFFPALSVFSGGIGFLGWARPTPFRSDQMRRGVNRRFGEALVSAAGPLSNLMLALIAAGIMSILTHVGVSLTREGHVFASLNDLTPIGMLLYAMLLLNVGLTVFNLLPFPPLDGHRLLPPAIDRVVTPIAPYGMLVLMGLFMLSGSVPLAAAIVDAVLYSPMSWLTRHIMVLFDVHL